MCAIKRLCILFIVTIFLMGCGGDGGGSNGTGSGDGCKIPSLVWRGSGFYTLIIAGTPEEVESPYAVDGFEEGDYLGQLVELGYNPINFRLYVWEDGYEVEPLSWPDNFGNLILEIEDG